MNMTGTSEPVAAAISAYKHAESIKSTSFMTIFGYMQVPAVAFALALGVYKINRYNNSNPMTGFVGIFFSMYFLSIPVTIMTAKMLEGLSNMDEIRHSFWPFITTVYMIFCIFAFLLSLTLTIPNVQKHINKINVLKREIKDVQDKIANIDENVNIYSSDANKNAEINKYQELIRLIKKEMNIYRKNMFIKRSSRKEDIIHRYSGTYIIETYMFTSIVIMSVSTLVFVYVYGKYNNKL